MPDSGLLDWVYASKEKNMTAKDCQGCYWKLRTEAPICDTSQGMKDFFVRAKGMELEFPEKEICPNFISPENAVDKSPTDIIREVWGNPDTGYGYPLKYIWCPEQHLIRCHCGWWHRAGTEGIGKHLWDLHKAGTAPDIGKCKEVER